MPQSSGRLFGWRGGVVTPYSSKKNKRTGETVRGSGKLEFEKDCEFDDIAGEYVLWRLSRR